MERVIRFRGISEETGEWVYGSLVYPNCGSDYTYIYNTAGVEFSRSLAEWEVKPESVGQFTGLTDKNGKEIFENDVVIYHSLKRYTQQSHYDVRPEIDELIIKKNIDKVVFKNGCFILSKDIHIDENFPYFSPISDYGLYSIESVKEDIFGEMLSQLDEEEQSGDCDGNEINESILGIEVIGNIHQDKNLLK